MDRAALGFLGFGLATVMSGGATAALWDGYRSHEKLLGWTATIACVACGIFLLLGLSAVVLSEHGDPVGWLIVRLVGLGVTAAVFGGFGIGMLYKAENKAT